MSTGSKPMKKLVWGYVAGFVASLLLTLGAYLIATSEGGMSMNLLAFTLLTLGVVQMLLQLRFFLHLGSETGPKWQSMSFVFTILMLLIVVVGSLWIMINLNYRMGMSADDMNQYMLEQNRKGF